MKHKKIIVISVAAAACLLLLSFASPVFNKVAEIISSFAAERGSGTETSEIIDAEESFFWMYTPELEPLTKEQVDACNQVYRLNAYGTLEDCIALYPEEKRDMAIEMYENAVIISTSRLRPYLGTFNEAIVVAYTSVFMEPTVIEIGDHKIVFSTSTTTFVYKNGTIMGIEDAYENGWLTYDDIGVIAERVEKYYDATYNGGAYD